MQNGERLHVIDSQKAKTRLNKSSYSTILVTAKVQIDYLIIQKYFQYIDHLR